MTTYQITGNDQYIIHLALLCLLLTACTTITSKKAPVQYLPWDERQQQLIQVKKWTIRGKVSMQAPQDSGTASVNWQQTGNQYHIRLFGPIGAGQLQLSGDPHQVSMTTAKRETVTAATPEQLLHQYAGWDMPVSNLHYWIRGLPNPQQDGTIQLDTYEHLQSLQQQGWTIHYQQYTSVKGIDLPTKIDLSKDQVKIRIVISKWEI